MDWLRLTLCDIHPAMCDAWARAFDGLPNVEIVCGRFEDVPEWDAIVAPGNSFGIMDGGLDLAIAEYFGGDLADRVQMAIRIYYAGEQPIGTALLLPTLALPRPWLIYAPTMRIPMRIPSENVYLAMAAVLRALNDDSSCDLNTVLIPALGMGTGGVPYDEGARLMALAYEYALHPPERIGWQEAVARHRRIMGEMR